MYLVISLFGFEGRIWDLIVSVPDHCLSFYFGTTLACVLLCLIILTFLASLLLKLRSQGQCFFGSEYLAKNI